MTGSTEQEVLAQVKRPAGALTAFGCAQSDSGPGHRLRLPKRATRKTFVRTGQDLSHVAAEITHQKRRVHRTLIGTDVLQDLRLHLGGMVDGVSCCREDKDRYWRMETETNPVPNVTAMPALSAGGAMDTRQPGPLKCNIYSTCIDSFRAASHLQ